MTWLLRLLSGSIGPYILGALAAVVAALVLLGSLQQLRIGALRNEIGALENQLQTARVALQQADAEAQLRAVRAAEIARQEFEDREDESRPVVERVVTRVVRQCAADRDLPMPAGSGVAAGAAARAGDDADRAFAEAVGRDLRYCNTELNRLRSVQRWLIANGASTQE